jgi:CheY-like chemotaxis protein
MVARPESLDVEPAVLIADDYDPWRDAVDEVLRRAGFRTVQAACGEEAVEIAQSELIDAALVDLHMPRLNGLETIRRMRRHRSRLPAALMTSQPEDVPDAEVRSLHIRFVVTKPADGGWIATVVAQLVWHG